MTEAQRQFVKRVTRYLDPADAALVEHLVEENNDLRQRVKKLENELSAAGYGARR